MKCPNCQTELNLVDTETLELANPVAETPVKVAANQQADEEKTPESTDKSVDSADAKAAEDSEGEE